MDALHFHRSRVSLQELRQCPADWFHCAHLCDCEAPIPTDLESLVHTGRAERLYPGEGAVPIADMIDAIPGKNILLGLEVPHEKRLQEFGFEEHARRALQAAKKALGES